MRNIALRHAAAALLLALAAPGAEAASGYDQAVLGLRPVMHLHMDPAAGAPADLSGNGHGGAFLGGVPAAATLPNGERTASFNGSDQYVSVPSSPQLSVPTKRVLTIVAWIKPGTLQFPNTENEDFVYFLGKGNPTDGYEYANRMYSLNNSAGRPNRISCYHWNTTGGLGSGSYFQDSVTTSQWIMITDVIDMNKGTIDIYKNGSLRDTTPLSQYDVTPRATNAPFNVGTRNYNSWFQGAVGKVSVFDRLLTSAELSGLYSAMTSGSASAPSPSPAPVPGPGPQPTPPSVAAEHLAPQRFLSPGLADGVNDVASFGPGAAEVTIMDLRGRRVFGASRNGSPIVWNGRDSSGRVVESGTYVAKIRYDGGTAYQTFAVAR